MVQKFRRWASAPIIAVAGWLALETLSWGLGAGLDALRSGMITGIDWAGLPWKDGLALILFIFGLWLAFGGPSKAERDRQACAKLAAEIDDLLNRIDMVRRPKFVSRPGDDNPVDISWDAEALLVALNDLGFTTPLFNTDESERHCLAVDGYFRSLRALMRGGHVDRARQASISRAKYAENVEKSVSEQDWFVHGL